VPVTICPTVTIGPPCPTVFKYGTGCAGSGGIVPVAAWTGCSVAGGLVSLDITNGLGGANALILFSSAQGNIPIGPCTLLVNPILGAVGVTLNGAGAGNGSLSIAGVIPLSAVNSTTDIQVWAFDSAVGIGGAATNGLEVQVIP